MILQDIAMLAVPNRRSHAYLDRLARDGHRPAFVLLLAGDGKVTPGQRPEDLGPAFAAKLDRMGIAHESLPSTAINSPAVVGALGARPERYVIYSGPGGAILGPDLLALGKHYLHVHPGRLPDFRGSTTVYYQLLASDTVGATAIFLEVRIDEGPVLGAREFPPPAPDEDLDYDYDPRVRAEVLGDTIAAYVRDGRFSPRPQPAGGETYFIMHPVLRHIAKLKVAP